MSILEIFAEFAWPLVALIVILTFGNKILETVKAFSHVEVTAKPMKITLRRLEQEYDVPKTQIKKLDGLTGHDLWALDAFLKPPNDSYKYVGQFDAQKKAMVYSFSEMGLLEIVGEGGARYVKPTDLARNVIDAASKLLD